MNPFDEFWKLFERLGDFIPLSLYRIETTDHTTMLPEFEKLIPRTANGAEVILDLEEWEEYNEEDE